MGVLEVDEELAMDRELDEQVRHLVGPMKGETKVEP